MRIINKMSERARQNGGHNKSNATKGVGAQPSRKPSAVSHKLEKTSSLLNTNRLMLRESV